MIRPAVVVVAYNRPNELRRLLSSLASAVYGTQQVPLLISLEGGAAESVVSIAESFVWEFGNKKVLYHDKRLGLRKHIMSCASLSDEFGAIVLLEDDIVVSPYYYQFAQQALTFYGEDDNVAGISLYSYRNNEYAECAPFYPLDNGFDAYFMQVPSSRGVCWTKKQWDRYLAYNSEGITITYEDKLPDDVKTWGRTSWKKDFCKYIVDCNLFFVVPYLSLSTNCGAIGQNIQVSSPVYQAVLSISNRDFHFCSFAGSTVKYDAYMEPMPCTLPSHLVSKYPNLCIDLYGIKQSHLFENEFWLTSRPVTNPVSNYGCEMIPSILNIIYDSQGVDICLCRKEDIAFSRPNEAYNRYAQVFDMFSYNEGQRKIRATNSYKLGMALIKPIKVLLSLFSKK